MSLNPRTPVGERQQQRNNVINISTTNATTNPINTVGKRPGRSTCFLEFNNKNVTKSSHTGGGAPTTTQQQRNNNATTTQQQRNNKTHKHGQGTLCSSVSCQGIQAKSMSSDHRIAGGKASTTQQQYNNNATTTQQQNP